MRVVYFAAMAANARPTDEGTSLATYMPENGHEPRCDLDLHAKASGLYV